MTEEQLEDSPAAHEIFESSAPAPLDDQELTEPSDNLTYFLADIFWDLRYFRWTSAVALIAAVVFAEIVGLRDMDNPSGLLVFSAGAIFFGIIGFRVFYPVLNARSAELERRKESSWRDIKAPPASPE